MTPGRMTDADGPRKESNQRMLYHCSVRFASIANTGFNSFSLRVRPRGRRVCTPSGLESNNLPGP